MKTLYHQTFSLQKLLSQPWQKPPIEVLTEQVYQELEQKADLSGAGKLSFKVSVTGQDELEVAVMEA